MIAEKCPVCSSTYIAKFGALDYGCMDCGAKFAKPDVVHNGEAEEAAQKSLKPKSTK